MNHRQSLISTPHATIAVLLEMGKKARDKLSVQILKLDTGSRLMASLLCILKQQRKTVSVRGNGVRADLPLGNKIFAKKLLY